ncbi:MAG TPA: acetate kinase, partial [Chthoniobacterales bacterium]
MTVENFTVLVVNCGSSSLKFSVLEAGSSRLLAAGVVERLGTDEAHLTVSTPTDQQEEKPMPNAGHREALREVIDFLAHRAKLPVHAIGHRVVHGGELFRSAVRIDQNVVDQIAGLSALAPLHNPASVAGIKVTLEFFPDLPQVAAFDTSFHQTLAPEVYHYAIPFDLYETHRIRRYGFHGISYRYLTGELARRLDRPVEQLQFVAAHLGNGCSATAIKGGRSVDTTMGLTPLEGLVMGTRSGDVDPSMHQILQQQTGMDLTEITDMLTKKSGLLGLSGVSHDFRSVVEAANGGNSRASLAIEVFCYRLARGLMALTAGLDRVDAIVFSGGIGEHNADVRARVLTRLKLLATEVDPRLNAEHGRSSNGLISHAGVPAYVVPTNEELMIAHEVAAVTG